MNGQFPSPDPVRVLASQFRNRYRLVVALIVSGLLHAALLTAPYLGGRTMDGTAQARQDRSPAQRFTASIGAVRQSGPVSRVDDAAPIEPAEGAGVLPFSAPHYSATDQLSKRPQPLASADLEGPDILPIVASGKIILKLWIDEFGEVNDVEIERSELPEVFSRSATAAFKRLRFTPGERGGMRVRSVMRIEVSYDDARSPAP